MEAILLLPDRMHTLAIGCLEDIQKQIEVMMQGWRSNLKASKSVRMMANAGFLGSR